MLTSPLARPAIADSVLDLVGNTPLVRLNRVSPPNVAEVLGKLESLNPAGSVKDRIALAMADAAERAGLLEPGATLVEPTSGTTGIGLAMVAAARGYRLILTMPEDMSLERRQLLARFGAEIQLTPAIEGMTGAVFAARELLRQHPEYFMPQQFENPANPDVHRRTTAQEILLATEGRVDALVAGVDQHYPETLRPALQVIGTRPGVSRVSGVYMMLWRDRILFLGDTTVNIEPSAEELAEIAVLSAEVARRFLVEPRIAMVSFSNFGSVQHPVVEKVPALGL